MRIPLNIIAKATALPVRVCYPDGREEVIEVGEEPIRVPHGTKIYPPKPIACA